MKVVCSSERLVCAVVGANMCVPLPIEVKGKGIGGVGGVAGKGGYSVRTVKFISQRQDFVVRCHSFCIGDVFALHSICVSKWQNLNCVPSLFSLKVFSGLRYSVH